MPTRRLCILVALLLCVTGLCCCARRPRESPSRLEIPATVVENPTDAVRIEINSASARELERLPGVGSGLAARIVAHRAQFGPFRRVEHLMMVRGISEKKFQVLLRYIEVR